MSGVTLWHVPVSHYSEKVRWALDLKRVPHRRRAVLGGLHPLVTLIVTRGAHHTVPTLVIDGEAIGDSTAIIAELERRFPDPPLYPADAEARRRALALEGFFDEELGPYVRRLAYHELIADPESLGELVRKAFPWAPAGARRLLEPAITTLLDLRFGVRGEDAARVADEKVRAALDRLEAELDGGPFLCGDALSVADVTAASLCYLLVFPPEGPARLARLPAPTRARLDELRDRPGLRWVADLYARHRRPPA